MLMTLFIVSCSSDPEVDAIAEKIAADSDGKVSEGDAKCVAKAMKKELSDEDFTAYHAIDDLHTDEGGNFFWNEDLEEELYGVLFSNFKKSCDENKAFIIVDAMNLEKKDYAAYVNYAEMAGYRVATIVPPQPSAKEAAKRNKHFVTEEQIEEMITRWEG